MRSAPGNCWANSVLEKQTSTTAKEQMPRSIFRITVDEYFVEARDLSSGRGNESGISITCKGTEFGHLMEGQDWWPHPLPSIQTTLYRIAVIRAARKKTQRQNGWVDFGVRGVRSVLLDHFYFRTIG